MESALEKVELHQHSRQRYFEYSKEFIQPLRASEERCHTISELASDYAYAFRVEPDGAFVSEWFTESFTYITGYTLEEIEARGGWRGLVHPEDMPILLQHRSRLLANQPDVSEFRIITRVGKVRWLRTYSHPIWDPVQGRVVRIYGSAQDIAERKRMEAQLASLDRELLTLHRISEMALRSQSLQAAFQEIVQEISAATGFPTVTIELYDEARQKMWFKGVTGLPLPSDGEELGVPVEETLSGIVVRTGRPLVETRAWERPEYANGVLRQLGIRTFACVPMAVNQRVIGTLSLAHPEATPLDDHFLRWIASLANYVASLTEWKRVEEALLQEKRRLDDVATYANCGLFLLDDQARVTYANRLAEEWFEAFHPIVGKFCWEVFNLKDPERECAALKVLRTGERVRSDTFVRLFHGEERYFYVVASPVKDIHGKIRQVTEVVIDITDLKLVEEQLLYNAFHDALTDLPNRALFVDRLGSAARRAKRHEDYLFAVLFLDIDRFKTINDSLGHAIGDQLLIAISRRLEACLRIGDTVARLEGDEFAILLDDIKDVSDAVRVADRLLKELMFPFTLGGQEVFATASIGIALSATGYDRPEDLLRDADTAMYRAKALGRARHEVFDTTMHARAVALLQVEMDLRRAVERREFQLHYQPIVSLASGEIVSAEALLRWQHPQRGLVSPMEFIPVAEETGLIIPIGEWVLRTACAQNQAWQDAGLPPLCVTVNLSAHQFRQKDLSAMIAQILRETGLDPHWLQLELTESAIMGNVEETISMLRELKGIGIRLSIDDFGTGYSSLSYLKRFSLDILKIDRSFVRDIATSSDDATIVAAVITLAHNLKLEVTAEGVETGEQLALLRLQQCDEVQGYLLSRPVPAELFVNLLSRGTALIGKA